MNRCMIWFASRLWLGLLLLCMASASPASEPAKLILVIDDLGNNRERDAAVLALPEPVVLSVLPHAPFSRQVARRGYNEGHSIMIHLPMAGSDSHHEELGTLRADMTDEQLGSELAAAMRAIPQAVAINNHQGSALTADAQSMRQLMGLLAEQRRFWFLDSRTHVSSQAFIEARRHGIPALKRDIFLDNTISEAAINKQIDRWFALAKQDGSAVAIGHPYALTTTILRKRLKSEYLAEKNLELVHPTTLLRRPPANMLARLLPEHRYRRD